MAAAIAEGETTLTSIEKIERGYGDLSRRLENVSLLLEKKTYFYIRTCPKTTTQDWVNYITNAVFKLLMK